MKKEIKVVIDGQVYSLSSAENEEYIQSVALYLDKKIEELKKGTDMKKLNSRMQTILLALNITDDLFKERNAIRYEKNKIEELQQENQRLQEEIQKNKQELDEYLKLLNDE